MNSNFKQLVINYGICLRLTGAIMLRTEREVAQRRVIIIIWCFEENVKII